MKSQTNNFQQQRQPKPTILNYGMQTQLVANHGTYQADVLQPLPAHSGMQYIIQETVSDGDLLNSLEPSLLYGSKYATTAKSILYTTVSTDESVNRYHGQLPYDPRSSLASFQEQSPPSGIYYNDEYQMGVQSQEQQVVTHQGRAYLVQQQDNMNVGRLLAPTLRASPATIQWLTDNYETAEGVSLPRNTLYGQYLRHCQQTKIEPMNPASFGKLIRSVFLGLRTRRLGTRGHSKYHYYGVRIKSTSPLNDELDEQYESEDKLYSKAYLDVKRSCSGSVSSTVEGRHSITSATDNQHPTDDIQAPADAAAVGGLAINTQAAAARLQHRQYMGDASAAMPRFERICLENDRLPPGVTADHIATYELLYTEQCEAMMDIVVNLQFDLLETMWKCFWRTEQSSDILQNGVDIEHVLPRDVLYSLCRLPSIHSYTLKSDFLFYQALVEVLIPDVLQPVPSSLVQVIRSFAKTLESCLKASMINVPESMCSIKLCAVGAFTQTIRRYTSLNHLAQAARAVLQNGPQVTQMLNDLGKVDFANVQEQASWVSGCNSPMVQQCEQDIKRLLQQQASLEQWAEWLTATVNQALQQHERSTNFPQIARQLLLNWSFYSSMVIRDLTLRSAASFGSFHLIRLLYDEYLLYLVEHRVAAVLGESPIATIGNYNRQKKDLESATRAIIDDSRIPVQQTADQQQLQQPGQLQLKQQQLHDGHDYEMEQQQQLLQPDQRRQQLHADELQQQNVTRTVMIKAETWDYPDMSMISSDIEIG